MNKLFCLISGGHRYADTNIIAYQHPNPDYVTLHNKCVKCGKEVSFDFCVGAYIKAEIAKRKEINDKKKTYRDDFLEKFPKAFVLCDGTPNYCVDDIYGKIEGRCIQAFSCKDCWNRTMKEDKNG